MNKSDLNFFLNQNVQIELSNFVLSLFCAAVLSFIVHLFYIRFSSSLSNRIEFSKNFVILGVATCIVIMIVKSSLALSLGLVGALSIVRFRAAIKEPEELVYLFLIIAVGLGCGAGQINITVIGIIFTLTAVYIFKKLNSSKYIHYTEKLNLALIKNQSMTEEEINILIKNTKKFTEKLELVSFSKSKDNTTINLDIQVSNFEKLNKLTDILKKNDVKVVVSKDDVTAL